MLKFSKNLLIQILLISHICKFSYCSNEIFEETTDFNEENDVFTFEDTIIDVETQTETDELFKETSEQASTSSIKNTTQKPTREETNATTDEATTNTLNDQLSTRLPTKTQETTNKIMSQVTEEKSSMKAKSTVQERSSPDPSSNGNGDPSGSVELTTQAVGTFSFSIQSSLLNAETKSLTTALRVQENPASSFNTRIQMNGVVRKRRVRTVKKVMVQLDRILFIEDVNVTNIEQALLKSIGYESIFNVTNEGNDEYSIGFTTDINTSVNSALSLDDSVLKIVQNLKRDESIIQAEANKAGFDLSIDTSKGVIYATETLVINGITYIKICEKTLDQVQMGCQQGTVENGTITIESNSDVDLESFANPPNFSKFLLFVVTIIFSFQIIY